MSGILEQFRRWKLASVETRSLLERNAELLDRREQLLQSTTVEFRGVLRVAHEFTEQVVEGGQEPATRSTSPRSR